MRQFNKRPYSLWYTGFKTKRYIADGEKIGSKQVYFSFSSGAYALMDVCDCISRRHVHCLMFRQDKPRHPLFPYSSLDLDYQL